VRRNVLVLRWYRPVKVRTRGWRCRHVGSPRRGDAASQWRRGESHHPRVICPHLRL